MPKVKVKAAVLERSRRSTAGKRMASLVGKAQDDDDTFWSHSIWSEAGGGFSDKKSSRKRRRDDDDSSSSSSEGEGDDDDSISDGEGSYRMSEDDSDAAVDQFDSDFDESETDDEDGPIDGDGEEEKELRAEERREKASKRKKNQRLGVPLKSSSAGRELIKRKGGAKMTKRGPLGEGWNEGLVLNWPPPSSSTIQSAVAKIGVAVPSHSQIQSSNSKLAAQGGTESSTSMPNAIHQTKPQHTAHPTGTKEIATKLPPSPIKSNLNKTSIPTTATSSSSTQPPLAKPKQNRQTVKQQRQAATTERKKSQRRQFTQEELILESIKSTETDNGKWLSARKRSKEEAAQLEKATVAKKSSLNQKPISRFHSRRGCVNTLTFMDMDHLPEILTRKQTTPSSFRSNVGISKSPKRRRVNSTTSETSESAKTATNTEATARERKCAITGKVARYKDPKTRQYYHDLDAYKELQRQLESGEIKIPQPRTVVVHKNNNRKRKSDNGSNAKKANGLRGGNANVAAPFPLASEQPTMVADMASNPSLKVTVTQNGIPVSPPTSAQKVPIETKIPVDASQDNRNGPPPILPTGVNKMEIDKATKTEEHQHINKVVHANAKSDVVSTTHPINTKRVETQPQPSPKNVDFENGLQDGKTQPQIAKDAVDDKNKSMKSNETQPAKQPTIEAK